MLNLVHANTFLTVLDERGFRAAARKLSLAPSTIAEHIRQLEADLAAPLIVRLRGHITPTPRGALFVPLARALTSTAARGRKLIAEAPLRLAASSNTGTYLLQPLLATFQSRYQVAAEQLIGSNPITIERLTSGQADAAVMEWWDDRPGFVAVTWRREALVVIVGPDHPWAGRRAIFGE
jgi:DNA-binding transcriptional LysR family regulator